MGLTFVSLTKGKGCGTYLPGLILALQEHAIDLVGKTVSETIHSPTKQKWVKLMLSVGGIHRNHSSQGKLHRGVGENRTQLLRCVSDNFEGLDYRGPLKDLQ